MPAPPHPLPSSSARRPKRVATPSKACSCSRYPASTRLCGQSAYNRAACVPHPRRSSPQYQRLPKHTPAGFGQNVLKTGETCSSSMSRPPMVMRKQSSNFSLSDLYKRLHSGSVALPGAWLIWCGCGRISASATLDAARFFCQEELLLTSLICNVSRHARHAAVPRAVRSNRTCILIVLLVS
jgi:hypothetical protein